MTAPASTCATCFKPGAVSLEQTDSMKNALKSTLRFECASGHAWTVATKDAEAHGRFIARLEAS